jgi:1,2-phenylacetyl-CoA epoxidase PaaB subunit
VGYACLGSGGVRRHPRDGELDTLLPMDVWEVLGKRTEQDPWVAVGGVKAPDQQMALLLARETHFRHKEGVRYGVRRRGDESVLEGPYRDDLLGGVTDHSYRRQEAYAGVGAKLKRVAEEMASRGLRIDRPRPAPGRARKPKREQDPSSVAEPPSVADLSPEDIAASGTAG